MTASFAFRLATACCMCIPLGAWLGLSARAASVYDFEGLSGGGLSGQDNWSILAVGDTTVVNGAGLNPTLVGQNTAGTSIMQRVNNGSFSYPSYSGTETSAIWQFDLYRATGHGGTMAVANDSGVQAGVGPFFGLTNGDMFNIRQAGFGSETNIPVAGAVGVNNWVRLRLDVDLTAHGGDGAGSLSYMNLTTGQTGFTPVPGLQNINLGLNAGHSPTTWNGLAFRTDSNGDQIDNLTLATNDLSDQPLYTQAVMNDAPTVYWRFGEQPGNSGPFEQVSQGVRGSYGEVEVFGVPGALTNDPADTAVRFPSGPAGSSTFSTGTALGQSLFGGQSELTLEMWIRPGEDAPDTRIFAEYGISDFSFEGPTLNPRFYVNNTFLGDVDLTQDEFQHIALVFNGTDGEASIYLNGELVSFTDSGVPSAINDIADQFYLARSRHGLLVPIVDFQELAIYQRALTAAEIQAHVLAAAVPEPATGLLSVCGLAMVMLVARRRCR